MPTLKRCRLDLWHWVLTALLLFTSSQSNGQAQAAATSAAKEGNHSDCHLLEGRTNELVMLDFASAEALKHLTAPKDFIVNRHAESVGITGAMKGRSQSLTITSGTQPWDLATYLYLVADIHNCGTQEVTIICRAEDPEYAGWHHFAESVARVGAGETTSVLVFLKRKNPPAENLRTIFPGMNALPDGYMPLWSGLDPSRITKVVLGLESSGTDLKLELSRLRAVGICDATALLAPDYFPFIDSYGQFRHADWPTKIHSPNDFSSQWTAEAASLKASGPATLNAREESNVCIWLTIGVSTLSPVPRT